MSESEVSSVLILKCHYMQYAYTLLITSIHMCIHNTYYACILCVYIYIYTHVCIYIYICIVYTYIYIYIYIYIHMYIYARIHAYIFIIFWRCIFDIFFRSSGDFRSSGLRFTPRSWSETSERRWGTPWEAGNSSWNCPASRLRRRGWRLGWFHWGLLGKILTGNHPFSHDHGGFPVKFPLNQSIDHWNVAEADVFSIFFLISPIRFPPLKEKFCYFFCISKRMTTSCTHPNITISLELEVPELG